VSARRPLAAIVLAAGASKRFKSSTPKVLHDLAGQPLLAYPLATVRALKPAQVVVVLGSAAQAVREAATGLWPRGASPRLRFADQKRLLGTADSARAGLTALKGFNGNVIVLPADAPLLEPATLRALVGTHERTRAAVTVLSARVEDPSGYGRVVRAPSGSVEAIVEQRDASAAQRRIDEINAGVYVFDAAFLRAALPKIGRANAQGEHYLPDVVAVARASGRTVEAVPATAPEEAFGVNDRAQLADLAAILRARAARRLMAKGVTIVDPSSTFVDATVRAGADTVIHPNTILTGDTRIGRGASIGPNVRAAGSTIGDRARVQFAVLDGAKVGREAQVGPFAYLRPGATLKARSKAGTFVEVKASTIGEDSKVPHLSYVGDASIGRDVNVGAATVTVNYDGETKKKSKTVIGDGAKIGSDTMLVAPVKVGKNAGTGAGSVVTRDVAPGDFVVGAPARTLRRRKGETT